MIASAAVVSLGMPIADPLIGLAITMVILRITWDSWRVVRAAAEEPVAAARSRAMSRSGEVPAVLDLLEHAVARRGPPVRVIA